MTVCCGPARRWTTSRPHCRAGQRTCHCRRRNRRRRAGGRPQRRPPAGRRPDARRTARGPLRVGGRRDGQGRRSDGEERLRVRCLPTAGRLSGHARVRRRRDPAHPPIAQHSQWFVTDARSVPTFASCTDRSRCSGTATSTWVLLEGHPADLDEQATLAGLEPTDGPPALPTATRWSLRRRSCRRCAGSAGFVAEIGVGIVHHQQPAPPRAVDAAIARAARSGSSRSSIPPGGSTPACRRSMFEPLPLVVDAPD